MPRNGSGVYSLPAGSTVTNGDTSDATDVNTPLADLVTDANTARPIVAGGTGATSASGARTALGLAIGTDVQAYDAGLADIAGLAVTDGNFIVGDGANWVAESGATVRASLGLTIGTDVQAYDAELAAIAGLTSAANKVPYFTGSGTAGLLDFLDEDTMSSDSATAVPSQQSVKAYVDTEISNNSSGMAFLASQDASNSATLDFTAFDGATYDAYVFVFSNVVPATDNVQLLFRTSTDGGSTYDTGASDYSSAGADTSGTGSSIQLSRNDVGSAAGEDGISGQILVAGPHLAKKTMITGAVSAFDNAGAFRFSTLGGVRNSSADVDAVRFFFSSGNIESGTITMYGLRNA